MRVEGRKFNSNFVKKYGHLTEVDYLASFLLVFDTRSRIARVRDDVPQFPDAFQVLQNAVREDKVCGHATEVSLVLGRLLLFAHLDALNNASTRTD